MADYLALATKMQNDVATAQIASDKKVAEQQKITDLAKYGPMLISKQADLEARLQAQAQAYQLVTKPVAASSVGLLAIAQLSEGVAGVPVQANYLREPDATFANPKKVSG
jgi:hypothetical protein